MLPVQPIPPPTAVQRPDDIAAGLRLNQRIVAEVLRIATDHVVLGLEGVPVVARLTSAEQSGALAEQRTAQFVVRGFSADGLMLELAGQAEHGAPATPTPAADVLPALLRQAGLPVDETTTRIARALIDHGLPVTPDLVDELAQALAQLPRWDAADAHQAAALRAAGLPLSAEAVALAGQSAVLDASALAQLQTRLKALADAPLPDQVAEALRRALQATEQMSLAWEGAPTDLASQLRELVATVGRSIEQQLLRNGPQPNADPQAGLLALAQLRGELARAGLGAPAEAALQSLDQFLDAARLSQFRNVAPGTAPPDGRWLNLNLPLGRPPGTTAHLRVAYRPDGQGDSLDASHTRLVLAVALEAGAEVQVDLSVVDRQIGAWVTATDEALREQAEVELPGLAQGLRNLGYILKSARCAVGTSPAVSGSSGRDRHDESGIAHLPGVNMEV